MSAAFGFGNVEDDIPQLPGVDLSWFVEREAFSTAQQLEELLEQGDWEDFLTKIGHDWLGFVDAFEGAPLEDYPPDVYLEFVENAKEIEGKMAGYVPPLDDDDDLDGGF